MYGFFSFAIAQTGTRGLMMLRPLKATLQCLIQDFFLNYSAVIWFGPIYNIQRVTSSCYLIGYSHLTPCAEWKSKTLNTVI